MDTKYLLNNSYDYNEQAWIFIMLQFFLFFPAILFLLVAILIAILHDTERIKK